MSSIEKTKQPSEKDLKLLTDALFVPSYSVANKNFSLREKKQLQKLVWGNKKDEIDGVIGPKTWKKMIDKAKSLNIYQENQSKIQLDNLRKNVTNSYESGTLFSTRNSLSKLEIQLLQRDVMNKNVRETDGKWGKKTETAIINRLLKKLKKASSVQISKTKAEIKKKSNSKIDKKAEIPMEDVSSSEVISTIPASVNDSSTPKTEETEPTNPSLRDSSEFIDGLYSIPVLHL
ncbi:hypothetical protein AGMMS50249_7280 [candidate division SR1 bacterium]|nr:hypothetical protein AGMMS50249_7280 [candidate division SR1 bacterium]